MSLSAIGQIGLTIVSLDRAVAFYRDALGLPLLFQAPNAAFFDCGGVRLMLTLPGEEKHAPGSIVYFKVDEIQAATAELKSRGVEFDREPHLVARMVDHHLWMAFFHDPDGNALALMCETPR